MVLLLNSKGILSIWESSINEILLLIDSIIFSTWSGDVLNTYVCTYSPSQIWSIRKIKQVDEFWELKKAVVLLIGTNLIAIFAY
jgi:hypothetical protein